MTMRTFKQASDMQFLSSLPPSSPPALQIKFIREKVNFKTLIDLRSEKELGMDDQMNSSVYEGMYTPSTPPSFRHTH